LADFGIMYEETYLEIEDSNKPPVILKINSNLEHTLMVRPEHYEKIKDYVAEFDELKRITEEEFLEGLTEKLPIISFLKTKEIFDVAKAVYHNPYVGIAIYKDTIVYASENIQRILGYSLNELKKLRPQDIVVGNQREVAEEAYSRRLKGEFFFKGYDYVKLRAKSGNYIYAFVFSSTILYQNSYAGLLFIIDVTKEVLFRKFYSILRDVNLSLIHI
jgi:PAS domain S-box-containing protein